jgi:hypothetical protein
VINKSAAGALTGTFQLTGFQPAAQVQVWQYGEAQDTAQGHTTDGHSALANFAVTLSVSGSTFSYSFPAYSMTILDLSKAATKVVPVGSTVRAASSVLLTAAAPAGPDRGAPTSADPVTLQARLTTHTPALRRPPVFDRRRTSRAG